MAVISGEATTDEISDVACGGGVLALHKARCGTRWAAAELGQASGREKGFPCVTIIVGFGLKASGRAEERPPAPVHGSRVVIGHVATTH